MYDISKKLNKFYRTKVVLPAVTQNELREKKKLNISRLKSGLAEYNNEHKTNYKMCENRVQGSMAMYTVVQNDNNDYDIDIAIVFEKDNLEQLGPLATRNMVANALKRKTKQFNAEPEVKTSCVRIKYEDGYHVDFAIYRRYKENESDSEYVYEHAGNSWTKRDIKALDVWFKTQNDAKSKNLRKIVRLSKMFCKSRDFWKNTPSGLLQTIICDEQFSSDTRIDLIFYNTMQNIITRLECNNEVNAPVDNNRPLTSREVDKTRVSNWKNRLEGKIKDLDVLFNQNCTEEQAIQAWGNFFNHDFWSSEVKLSLNEAKSYCLNSNYLDTEEFIEDMYIIQDQYYVNINCKVMGNGFSLMPIQKYLNNYANMFNNYIPHNFSVKCSIDSTDAPQYDKVLWKVRNVGIEAEKRNQVRGQIKDRGSEITEKTNFFGHHFIECYLIKNNICIGIGHVSIPIGKK